MKQILLQILNTVGRAAAVLLLLFLEAVFLLIMMVLDILPMQYWLVLLAAMAVADVCGIILIKSYNITKQLAGAAVCMAVCILLCSGSYVMAETYVALQKISAVSGLPEEERTAVTEQPFNVCVTGIDIWGEIDQVSRSDVNMIVTVNPSTRTVMLTSVPRDSYVILHSFGQYDKLTHSGVWGVDETVKTLEDWLDIDIDYYVRVNFSMLVDIVNAIGGIDVYSDYAFKSAIHDCSYKKGWNHLNGKQALYFARERKAFKDQDQQRIKNQQKVMKACLKKVTSSRVLLTNYTKLLDAVDDEMETDMSGKEMTSLVKMQLADMDKKWTIKTQSVRGDLTMKGTYTMGMGRDLLVSIPREKSVEKVKRGIDKTYHPEKYSEEDK